MSIRDDRREEVFGDLVETPRLFLLDLAAGSLPRQASSPVDLNHVRVLTSTGLIVSESFPPFAMHGRNLPVQQATVLAITAEGRAEIESIRADLRESWRIGREGMRESRRIARVASHGTGASYSVSRADFAFALERDPSGATSPLQI